MKFKIYFLIDFGVSSAFHTFQQLLIIKNVCRRNSIIFDLTIISNHIQNARNQNLSMRFMRVHKTFEKFMFTPINEQWTFQSLESNEQLHLSIFEPFNSAELMGVECWCWHETHNKLQKWNWILIIPSMCGDFIRYISNYNTRENLTLDRMQRLMIIPVILTLWCEIVFIELFGYSMPAIEFVFFISLLNKRAIIILR